MKKLLLSVAASALILPLSAYAGDSAKSKSETAAQTTMDKSAANYKANGTVGMEAGSLSAKDLLGEGIRGGAGERIARIDDIVLDANGQAHSAVFLSGGVFGLGGKRGALDYDQLEIALDESADPMVSVSLSEEAIQAVAEYKTEEMNDYSLVSELLGAKLDLKTANQNEDDDAVINDIILSKSGMVEHLIIQKSVIGSIGAGDRYAVAFGNLGEEQGDGGLVLDITEDELSASPKYMPRSRWDNTWDSTRHEMKDAADDVGDAAKDIVDQ